MSKELRFPFESVMQIIRYTFPTVKSYSVETGAVASVLLYTHSDVLLGCQLGDEFSLQNGATREAVDDLLKTIKAHLELQQ